MKTLSYTTLIPGDQGGVQINRGDESVVVKLPGYTSNTQIQRELQDPFLTQLDNPWLLETENFIVYPYGVFSKVHQALFVNKWTKLLSWLLHTSPGTRYPWLENAIEEMAWMSPAEVDAEQVIAISPEGLPIVEEEDERTVFWKTLQVCRQSGRLVKGNWGINHEKTTQLRVADTHQWLYQLVNTVKPSSKSYTLEEYEALPMQYWGIEFTNEVYT